jgi:hypothetical protein
VLPVDAELGGDHVEVVVDLGDPGDDLFLARPQQLEPFRFGAWCCPTDPRYPFRSDQHSTTSAVDRRYRGTQIRQVLPSDLASDLEQLKFFQVDECELLNTCVRVGQKAFLLKTLVNVAVGGRESTRTCSNRSKAVRNSLSTVRGALNPRPSLDLAWDRGVR